MEKLQRDMKELGIINVEVSGNLTIDLLEDAVQVVKEVNIDFNKFAQQMEEERKRGI
ncbi:MAG: hypothetical protein ACTTKL_09410 [Treponema sp.]